MRQARYARLAPSAPARPRSPRCPGIGVYFPDPGKIGIPDFPNPGFRPNFESGCPISRIPDSGQIGIGRIPAIFPAESGRGGTGIRGFRGLAPAAHPTDPHAILSGGCSLRVHITHVCWLAAVDRGAADEAASGRPGASGASCAAGPMAALRCWRIPPCGNSKLRLNG